MALDRPLRDRVAHIRGGHQDLMTLVVHRAHAALTAADTRSLLLRRYADAGDVVPGDVAAAARVDADRTWREHCELRELVRPESQPTTMLALRLSWVAYCRHALLACLASESAATAQRAARPAEQWPAALLDTASDFAHVRALTEAEEQASLAPTLMLGAYPAHLVLESARLLVDILDQHGWSPSAGDYLEALFWRYALYVHELDDGVNAYEPDNGTVIDPLAPSPLLPAGSHLTEFFLESGERLFFHMLWRHRALRHYTRAATAAAAIPAVDSMDIDGDGDGDPEVADIPAAARALSGCLVHVLRHSMMGDSVTESIKTPLMDYFLWPGEREHMRFVYADEGDSDANSVLYRLRPDAYAKLQAGFNDVALPALIEDYTRALLAVVDKSPPQQTLTIAAALEAAVVERQSMVERIVLLATETCIDAAVAGASGPLRVFARHSYTDNAALDPPRDRPPLSIAAARTAVPDGWPLFIAVWGVYTVIPPTYHRDSRVMTTPHLALAVRQWLRLALDLDKLRQADIALLGPDLAALLALA